MSVAVGDSPLASIFSEIVRGMSRNVRFASVVVS